MKIKLVFVCFIYLLSFKSQAQVGIGTTSPDASSILDVSSTDKGVLVPRINLINVTNTTTPIATPATGLLVWNTNAAVTGGNGVGFYFFNGAQWTPIQQTASIDHDFYEEGTTTAPDNINDDQFTMGNLAIGKNTADSKLDIYESINSASNLISTDIISNTSSGSIYTMNNQLDFTGSGGVHYFLNNQISGSGTPLSLIFNRNYLNNVNVSSSGAITGVYNGFTGNTDAQLYSFYTYDNISGSGLHYGLYNRFNNSNGTGERGGVYNYLTNSSSGNQYGVRNYILNSVSGNLYGVSNRINGNGAGNKYGTYNFISSTSGGNHYGVYSEVLKSGSFAGYFLGNVSIGTTTTNNYIFPSTRGTANQIMQTDGVGNITWVDSTSVGDNDHDFYEEGTTTAPDDINDDQFTMGNLGIGKNTADYSIDIETSQSIGIRNLINGGTSVLVSGISNNISSASTGQQYGMYNIMNASTTATSTSVRSDITSLGTGYGTYNNILASGSGNGNQFGVSNIISHPGNGEHYGIDNLLNGSGTGIHYGIYNTLTGAGTGRQYGVYNEIDNSGNSNHFGSYSALTGTGSGSHYGNWVRLEGAGTGNQIGAYNFINNTGNGDHYGSYNVLSGTGSGPHYGNWARILGTGTGLQYGNYINITNSGNANHYGTYNDLSGSGSGSHYGNWIRLQGTGTGFQIGDNINIDNSGNNNHWGEFIVLSGSGSGGHRGSEILLSGIGDGQQYGNVSVINNTGNGNHYGAFTTLNGDGSGTHYGQRTWLYGDGIGQQTGSYTDISNTGNNIHTGAYYLLRGTGSGGHFGTAVSLTGAGSGTKYGFHSIISSTAGGTHYGVYSNALKTGSYAGYFLGNVSIGTTVANNYILPASRGTNGQIMQTDGAGNLSWVDGTSLSHWTRTGSVLNLTNAGDDITFTNDQTSITFPASNGTPAPMLYMFSGGTANTDKMVLAHSATYSNYGLLYDDADEAFRFISAGTEIMEIDLVGTPVVSVTGNMYVNGDIITDTTTYPDYVFESYYNGKSDLKENYSLLKIDQLEKFIKDNKHLPNVKSYQEVKDDGMTIDVGDMTVTNLEKIEEAYLYIIELKKENDLLRKKLEAQQQEINEIKDLLKM